MDCPVCGNPDWTPARLNTWAQATECPECQKWSYRLLYDHYRESLYGLNLTGKEINHELSYMRSIGLDTLE